MHLKLYTDEKDPETNEVTFGSTVANNGYSGDLEIALVPDSFRKDILKEEEDANSEIRNTQSQLKNVDKLLKLDLGNTELLAG